MSPLWVAVGSYSSVRSVSQAIELDRGSPLGFRSLRDAKLLGILLGSFFVHRHLHTNEFDNGVDVRKENERCDAQNRVAGA